MNNKAAVTSLLMALIAVFFVDSYIESREAETKQKFGAEVVVVVASKDIKEMDTINETMIELKTIPKRFLEPAAISFSKSEAENANKESLEALIGSVAIVSIKAKEQLTLNKITEPGIRTGLSPQVTPGRRAVTLPVNEITGVGKLVKPGDRVDIIVTLDIVGGKEYKFTKTLLQDVPVLAVGRNVTNNIARILEKKPNSKNIRTKSLNTFDRFDSVTVEVEPAQAQILAVAVNHSSRGDAVYLSLRNNEDTERVNVTGVSLKDILGSDQAKVRALAAEKDQKTRRRSRR